ncbi:MAG: TolC family protein [Armatimonadetes bacterium]|nr:TolC family protein [Armatimonadota bacterium]
MSFRVTLAAILVIILTFPAVSCADVSVPLPDVGLGPFDGPQRAISLEDAMSLALKRNLDLKMARENISEQEANKTVASSAFLPSLDVAAGSGKYSGSISRASDLPSTRLRFDVNPAEAAFGSAAARAQVVAASSTAEAEENLVILSVAERFFELEKALAEMDIVNQSVAQTRELVQINEDLEKSGLGLESDTLQARAQASEAEQQLVEAQRRYAMVSLRLAEMLNLEPTTLFVPKDTDIRQVRWVDAGAKLDELVAKGLDSRAEVKQSAAEIASAKSMSKSAKWNAVLPRLGWESWLSGAAGSGLGWFFVGATILDHLGARSRGQIRKAQSQLLQAQLDDEAVREKVKMQIAEARNAAIASEAKISSAEAGLASAEEAYRISERRLKNGVGLTLEVLRAQEALARARTNLVAAIAGFNAAQARLAASVGVRLVGESSSPPASEAA